jgi:DNA excision repair protein ERCC-3
VQFRPENPLIVQGDKTILLEVHSPRYEEARDALARFAELEKSPEHIHTYRVSNLSLWNAAAAGMGYDDVAATLVEFSKYDVPSHLFVDLKETFERYGKLALEAGSDEYLHLRIDDPYIAREITHNNQIMALVGEQLEPGLFTVPMAKRGVIKQALLKLDLPVADRAGFVQGDELAIAMREVTRSDKASWSMRPYQREAVDVFYRSGSAEGGHGVIVLPCGAGKTIVGLGTMLACQTKTLVLATGIAAVRQWIREILERTDLKPSQVGEYTGSVKEIKPVTVTTYQILTHRKSAEGVFTHLDLFLASNWGLIIYDEVHLLPAPVFRITSGIQARRRLGLTATLVREDGREGDVFTLIGPKRYDVPWKEMEGKGFIAEAHCHEIRLELPNDLRPVVAAADKRAKVRLASENPRKVKVVGELLQRHKDDQVLVIGMYLDQLDELARRFKAPLITGKTPNDEREKLYRRFRAGKLKCLVVSKVANFSIDLPDANIAIQVSGTFGSRQEEAQRLGRILRPGQGRDAHFYSLVTRNTREQHFAHKRQLFLTEQGYSYSIEEWDEENGLTPASAEVPGLRTG